MQTSAIPSGPMTRGRPQSTWLTSRPLWGGAAIGAMWLAVLVVGVWGGNVNTAGAGGGSSSWPVVAVIALFALIATVPVARYTLRASPEADDLRSALEAERLAREQLADEVRELREELADRV